MKNANIRHVEVDVKRKLARNGDESEDFRWSSEQPSAVRFIVQELLEINRYSL